MNTVKHYKDLGLEFVEGDNVDNCSDNDGSQIIPLSEVLAARCNEGRYDFDSAPTGEFAWRKNTGEKPAYKGEIEVYLSDGGKYFGFVNNFKWQGEKLGFPVKKWRPLLIQPEPQLGKPVFTREAKQGGAIPPVDSDFMACGLQWTCVATHTDGGAIGEDANANLRRFTCEDCKPLRTQRDIEIDLIGGLIEEYTGEAANQNDISLMHEMGYRVTKVEE